MASAAGVTEKPIAHQNQQQQQQVVKCPRCHSSNTKFCYYNNYSLSQPRHFCKGCKRYWTRGGTLRNVPVGGGCRKNKRIKRPPQPTIRTPYAAATSGTVGHDHNTNLDHISYSAPSNSDIDHRLNPLLNGLLPQNPKYPRLDSRVSNHVNDTYVSRFDLLQPRMSYLGLEFSSSDPGASVSNQAHNSYSLVSSYPSMFSGGSTSLCTSDPMMASLLASSLQQQPRFLGFGPYGDGSTSAVKDVQMEGTQNMMYGNNNFHSQNDSDQIKAVESSDPTSFLWSTAGGDGGDWLDPASNIGSSVPSLI